ncbi:MAG TPA: class I SAM-dependent methyltransferase [Allosphingosinicella sp.]|jgi:hypothetical protein|uniref:hypothetical protein n=1 Tax=Allosphingosinicella sp. TaxID=2823234 RepID=UPI002F290E09
MSIKSNLTANRLLQFKGEINNENQLISEALRRILPPAGAGILLDVGAGLGDIAARAFADREALLIDILDFPDAECSLHTRQTIDFFDLPRPERPIDVMLMSHVVQYLDDDIGRLVDHVQSMSAEAIVLVSNKPTKLHLKIVEWFARRGVVHNAEQFFARCPLSSYRLADRVGLTSRIQCADIEELARQLSSMIYDVELEPADLRAFSDWLAGQVNDASVDLPQTISLLRREAPDA